MIASLTSDVSEQLKSTLVMDFSEGIFFSKEKTPTLPNIVALSHKFDRQDKSEFDEILAALKNKLQL